MWARDMVQSKLRRMPVVKNPFHRAYDHLRNPPGTAVLETADTDTYVYQYVSVLALHRLEASPQGVFVLVVLWQVTWGAHIASQKTGP